ncbi:PA2169 family four-helix-bundle protein [uncultured Algimonas sp.]|uniref:PA2169 family four-helix-bundle protein n=1 Tax=uncultured Algimonas sp. TaxID=1547920 RepID=UPI00262F8424|nr:PA2169 family four-helix-bundle protein [uncultured Algimonas sp.]
MTKDIDILNDVTKVLIDSHKGYETCVEVSDDSYALQSNFRERAERRAGLIREFQAEVQKLGGAPSTAGSVAGAAHRAWTSFTTLFADDEKAAIEAIDDGEEFLADKIEDVLKDEALQPRTRELLQKAHADAREGERFADALDNAL